MFNSLFFLFLFLPACIIVYLLVENQYKNYVALVASIVFFILKDYVYIPLMVFIIIFNYYLAKGIEGKRKKHPKQSQSLLILGCIINLVLLVFFKAFAVYGSQWHFLPKVLTDAIKQNPLPLGLSYITFQVISYLVDVYNKRCDSEKSLINYSLYILLFPKILVGPITPYRNLASSFLNRETSVSQAASGIRRFILGLIKKVLIADTIATAINPAYSLSSPNFSTGIAWFVLIAYAIQIYFDFSGYTDMAIGLGKVLGFKFVENFNYPYISQSIAAFWRRWHISLASWFRDYVFYPLEFQFHGSKFLRQQINIMVVFLLLGLWHGLTLNYLIWGGMHGIALAIEMTYIKKIKRLWLPLQHLYTIIIILSGWVFFRSSSLNYALDFFARLLGSKQGITQLPFSVIQPLPIINHSVWIALIFGIIFSLPVLPYFRDKFEKLTEQHLRTRQMGQLISDLVLLAFGVLSVAALTNTGLSASIYGGF